jgi:hypothetical protein
VHNSALSTVFFVCPDTPRSKNLVACGLFAIVRLIKGPKLLFYCSIPYTRPGFPDTYYFGLTHLPQQREILLRVPQRREVRRAGNR